MPEPLRRRLAVKAFRHTQGYDAAIADWLERTGARGGGGDAPAGGSLRFPSRYFLDLAKEIELRYGENPHQPAAVYAALGGPGLLGGMRQLQGKELSWNNLLDADAARKMVSSFDRAGGRDRQAQQPVRRRARRRPRGRLPARARRPTRCRPSARSWRSTVRPGASWPRRWRTSSSRCWSRPGSSPARASSSRPRRTCACSSARSTRRTRPASSCARSTAASSPRRPTPSPTTRPPGPVRPARQPTDEERRALDFAWTVCRYVKSNAIVIANAEQTVGIGAGQMSRVDSCRLAVEKARLPVAGTVAASDAFFPFRDGLDAPRRRRRHRRDPARRQQARRRGHRRRRRARRGDAVHRDAALPALRARGAEMHPPAALLCGA